MNKPVYLGLSKLEISEIVIYEFRYDYVEPKNGEKLNQVPWAQTILQSTKKQKRFIRILQKMLKLGMILRITNQVDHFLKWKIKK